MKVTQEFLGCCGAVTIWFEDAVYFDLGKSSEEAVKDKLTTLKNTYSVCLAILTDEQEELKRIATKFGFKRCWGPITNKNTGAKLSGYIINLNTFKTAKEKKLKKRMFGGGTRDRYSSGY